MLAEKNKTEDEALIEIYKVLRPGIHLLPKLLEKYLRHYFFMMIKHDSIKCW